MKGMTLALLDGLSKMFEWLLDGILQLVINVVSPIIQFLLTLISYLLGIYFYQIGVFILGLVDFVEMLFRSLAGLAIANDRGIAISIAGGEGDILVQLIRNKDVQQAFLAMCIVGLFLLVVTSVFQIIKVEYTTEGAKNSKTPILQKAFKGLANLMLLPILCIFGIVFSNQLLGLLDKATKTEGDATTTISGLVFSTAASDAFYKKGETKMYMRYATPSLAIVELLNNLGGILKNAWNDAGEDFNPELSREYALSEEKREEIQSNFQTQQDGYKYYDIENVSQYYNYSNIDYLILILSGIVILKAFLFTSFGMVMRLYKCAVLFIISPAVIGMTPINEGGLGKWRGQFVGQVLSAYGTILSVNLYIILIRVFINIDISFVGFTQFVFSKTLMAGLLKAIFVMVGALMIEQFSKEIGGYFGAEDAMSAGKGMAKQVGDTAMKGVKVAAKVGSFAATGGASLAIKAGQGIAGAVGSMAKGAKGGFENTEGKFGKKLLGATKGAVWDGGIKKAGVNIGKTAKNAGLGAAHFFSDGVTMVKNKIDGIREDELRDEMGNNAAAISARKNYDQAVTNSQEKISEIDDQISKAGSEEDRAKLEAQKSSIQSDLSKMRDEGIAKYGNKWMDDNFVEATNSRQDEIQKVLNPYDRHHSRLKSLTNAAAVGARGVSYFGAAMKGLGDEAMQDVPGFKVFQNIDKAAHAGAKAMKGNHAANMEKIDELREDRVKNSYNGTIFAGADKVLLGAASIKFSEQVGSEVGAAQQNLKVEAGDTFRRLADELERLQKSPQFFENGQYTEGGAQMYHQAINAALSELNSKGANLNFSDVENLANKTIDLGGKIDISLADLKIDFDPKKIEKSINDALRKSGGAMKPEVLRDELQKIFNELGLSGNKNMLMQIEAIIKKVMNDLK